MPCLLAAALLTTTAVTSFPKGGQSLGFGCLGSATVENDEECTFLPCVGPYVDFPPFLVVLLQTGRALDRAAILRLTKCLTGIAASSSCRWFDLRWCCADRQHNTTLRLSCL
jgi:hypothetical protein